MSYTPDQFAAICFFLAVLIIGAGINLIHGRYCQREILRLKSKHPERSKLEVEQAKKVLQLTLECCGLRKKCQRLETLVSNLEAQLDDKRIADCRDLQRMVKASGMPTIDLREKTL